MQTTLRLGDAVYRDAKVEAARRGITLTRFIEAALREHIARGDATRDNGINAEQREETEELDRLMESLLQATAHFRIGPKATRQEMNER